MTAGHIEVVCGSMFSGKSEELIRRVRRAQYARQKIVVFKPGVDIRSDTLVMSHDGRDVEAISVATSEEILDKIPGGTSIVAIDEAQFFDKTLPDVCNTLAESGKRVIVAGLDMDFRGEPFGPMPRLIAQAEDVLKLHAICLVCGEEASRTQRIVNGQPASYDEPIILVGAEESYEARCRQHHQVPGKPD